MPRPPQRRRNERARHDDFAIIGWAGVDPDVDTGLDLNAQLNASTETPTNRRRPDANDPSRGHDQLPAPRPRLRGWSLIFVTAANLVLVLSVTVVGLSLVGIVACAALALVSWILVLAEALSLRRLYGPPDPGLDADLDVD
ncbi:MAG: hypothetical protein AAGA93_08460 [Actinomycetota bacterium]